MNKFKKTLLATAMVSGISFSTATMAGTVETGTFLNGMVEVRIDGGSWQWVTGDEWIALALASAEETANGAPTIQPFPNPQVISEKTVVLKFDNGKYLSSHGGTSLHVERSGVVTSTEKFIEQDLGNSQFAYLASDGSYVGALYVEYGTIKYPLISGISTLDSSSVFTKDSSGRIKNLDGLYVDDPKAYSGADVVAMPSSSSVSGATITVEDIGNVDIFTLVSNLSASKHPDHLALVIKDLPSGVAIQGKATPPSQRSDINRDQGTAATYHQIVDYDAYINNELKVVVNKGFKGDINLKIKEFYVKDGMDIGTGSGPVTSLSVDQVDVVHDALDKRLVGTFSKTINLTPNTAFAAMTGSVRFDRAPVVTRDMKVSLKTKDGYYVQANGEAGNDKKTYATDMVLSENEKFIIREHVNGRFTFATVQDVNEPVLEGCGPNMDWLSQSDERWLAEPDELLLTGENRMSGCSKFQLFQADDGKVAFRANDRKHYWNAVNGGGGKIKVNEDQLVGRAMFEMEELDAPNRSTTLVPVYFAINPNITGTTTVTLSNVPEGAKLIKSDQVTEIQGSSGTFIINNPEATYYLDIESIDGSFDIDVEMNATDTPKLTKSLHIADITFFSSSSKENVAAYIPFLRNSMAVTRVGNAWNLKQISTGNTFSINMVEVPILVFENGKVSLASHYSIPFYVEVLQNDTLVVVHNVPRGAVINNSFPMGNNAFGLLRDRLNIVAMDNTTKAKLFLETSTVYNQNSIYSEDDIDGNIETYSDGTSESGIRVSTSQHVFTQGQITKVEGMTISGTANAKAYAEAEQGSNFSYELDNDGLAMEAGAHQHFTAVVSAGATASAGKVADMNATASAEVTVHREVAVRVAADKHETSTSAYAGQENVASLRGDASIESPVIPGTRADTGAGIAVSSHAFAMADGSIAYGHGKYGAEGEAVLSAGYMVTAEAYASGSVAGVGGGASGGVTAGEGAAIGGSGAIMYDHGKIDIAVSGELAALLGVKTEIDISVDINEVADTVDIIDEDVFTAADAVAFGLITAGEAINDFGLDTYDALEMGLISTEEAIETFGADIAELSTIGYKNVRRFGNKVGNKIKFWK